MFSKTIAIFNIHLPRNSYHIKNHFNRFNDLKILEKRNFLEPSYRDWFEVYLTGWASNHFSIDHEKRRKAWRPPV